MLIKETSLRYCDPVLPRPRIDPVAPDDCLGILEFSRRTPEHTFVREFRQHGTTTSSSLLQRAPCAIPRGASIVRWNSKRVETFVFETFRVRAWNLDQSIRIRSMQTGSFDDDCAGEFISYSSKRLCRTEIIAT